MALPAYQKRRELRPETIERARDMFGKLRWVVDGDLLTAIYADGQKHVVRYVYLPLGPERAQIHLTDGTSMILRHTERGFCMYHNVATEEQGYGECFRRMGT